VFIGFQSLDRTPPTPQRLLPNGTSHRRLYTNKSTLFFSNVVTRFRENSPPLLFSTRPLNPSIYLRSPAFSQLSKKNHAFEKQRISPRGPGDSRRWLFLPDQINGLAVHPYTIKESTYPSAYPHCFKNAPAPSRETQDSEDYSLPPLSPAPAAFGVETSRHGGSFRRSRSWSPSRPGVPECCSAPSVKPAIHQVAYIPVHQSFFSSTP